MLGGACAIDEECMGDAYCSADTACPGTCQAFGGAGAACTRDPACQQGLQCTNGSCQTPGGAGASCQGMTGVECVGGYICQGGSTTMAGTCTSAMTVFSGASGTTCSAQTQHFCAAGLSCVIASASSQTCGPDNLAAGAACHIAVPDQCSAGFFCSGATLMAAGTCTALPTDGMPCGMSFGANVCAENHVCESGTCRPIRANGGACTTDNDCFGGHCTGSVCTAPTYCPS
jgi:hypothetical protein